MAIALGTLEAARARATSGAAINAEVVAALEAIGRAVMQRVPNGGDGGAGQPRRGSKKIKRSGKVVKRTLPHLTGSVSKIPQYACADFLTITVAPTTSRDTRASENRAKGSLTQWSSR